MRPIDRTRIVFDPRGVVTAVPHPPAPRRPSLEGARVAILDNSKWNAGQLLRRLAVELEREGVGGLRHYKKDSFSRVAPARMVAEIARDNDVVVTAIGD